MRGPKQEISTDGSGQQSKPEGDSSEICTDEFLGEAASLRDASFKDATQCTDVKEAAVHSYLISIRRLRNAKSPMCQLPHETLAEVFSFLLTDDPNSWRIFTQICIHLRAVALSFPKLWSHIKINHPPLAELFLSRCSRGPVHIMTAPPIHHYCQDYCSKAATRTHPWQNWGELLSSCARRIRTICFNGSTDAVINFLRLKELNDLPTIEVLDLEAHPVHTLALRANRNTLMASSWNSETSRTSSLTTLRLMRVPLPPDPQIFRNVRHLKISNPETLHGYSLNLGQLLDALRAMILLETLELSAMNTNWSAASPHLERFEFVDLPNLVRFHINDTSQNIVQLVTHLSIPIQADLFIATNIFDVVRFIFNLLPANRDRFRHFSGIRSLKFDSTGPEGIEIHGDRFHLTLRPILDDPEAEETPESLSPLLLLQILQELPNPCALEELDVLTSYYPIGHIWCDVLKEKPALKKLRISHIIPCDEEGTEPCCVLLTSIEADEGIFCPSLNTLELNNTNFGLLDDLADFIEFLRRRKLKELRLSTPRGLDCKAHEIIAQLVGHFECYKWEGCRCQACSTPAAT